jgi:enoyl-CoA hydratase
MLTSDSVRVEHNGKTAVITLNRPERRNAINQNLLMGLYDALEMAEADGDIRAVILTGAGKSFCSGLDLDAVKTDNLFDPRGDGKDFPEVVDACRKPIIGAINGHAITGGLEIALQCDFLIASDQALFADTHARVGIHPGWGMTQFLQEAVGMRRAKQMSSTCGMVDANTALQWGLVNEVVSHGELMPRAGQLAGEIAETDPGMLQTILDLMETRRKSTLEAALDIERRGFEAFVKKNLLRP